MGVVGGKGLRKPLIPYPAPGGDHARMPGSRREPAEEREGPPIPSKDDDAQKQRQSHKQGKENVFRGKESEKKAEKEEPNSPLKQELSAKGQTTGKGEGRKERKTRENQREREGRR